jgi:hypothetical protein
MKQIRGHQGDVQFASIPSIPTNAKPIKPRPIALGEHSGHQHVVTGDVQYFEHDGRIICAVGSDGAMLQHIHESNFEGWQIRDAMTIADHKPITLPAGYYEFFIQNAYNPFAKMFEKVID